MITKFKIYEDAMVDAGNSNGMGAISTAIPSAIPGDVAGSIAGSGDFAATNVIPTQFNLPIKRKKKIKKKRKTKDKKFINLKR